MSLPDAFVPELEALLGTGSVITEPEQLKVYDCDGLASWREIGRAHV